MAVLSPADRREVWAEYMRALSARIESAPLLKADLRSAVDAIDDWVELNQSAFNLAIPLPARTVLTTKQKAELLMFVVRRRFEVT